MFQAEAVNARRRTASRTCLSGWNGFGLSVQFVSRTNGHHATSRVQSALRLQAVGNINGTNLPREDKKMDCTNTKQDRRFHDETPVVKHPVMQALYSRARDIASSSPRACVLLLGETGVGKDVLARAIHAVSPRAKGPFVAVNCSAIPESMFEREMFGHKKGTFTDATSDAKGYFEAADGGTLFLDEMGELPLAQQAKLLRVLDDRRINRVGDPKSRAVNVRIIAATNQRLDECIARGTFRRDLYYRLRAFELEVPPLRSRLADIVPLAEAFVEEECRAVGQMVVPCLSREVVSILEAYDFPGNVRDLRNAMMCALAHCHGNVILPEHLPVELQETVQVSVEIPAVMESSGTGLSEKDRYLRAFYETGGNHVRMAELLGISKRTLYNRLNQFEDFPRPRKRNS